MFEPERGSGRGTDRESAASPVSGGSQEHTDHPLDKLSGKRRHSTKDRFSARGSSFRAKKLRQEVSTSDLGQPSHTRHKQQASVSSFVLPPVWQRLRNFGHHDLQSASLERYGSGKTDGSRPTKKKPTGASAAHLGQETPLETLQNELLAVCPAFRNEIGGDADWTGVHPQNNEGANLLISFKRSLSHDKQKRVCSRAKMILEGSVPSKETVTVGQMDRQVLLIQQAQTSVLYPFEFIDYGSLYYRNHFYQQEHQNFFGTDEACGPLAISLKRERVSDELTDFFEISMTTGQAPPPKHQYRIIVRTAELETLRGTILEDSIPSGTKTGTNRGLPPREVIDYISQGEFHVSCLKVAKQEKKVCQELMRLDEQELNNRYKVGILYCKSGQSNEEEMYNNESGSPAFEEFLRTIGHKVTMRGFSKYRAQLDNKTDTTGTHSVYTEFHGSEIMFHVSTYLPHTPSNTQQLLRKRHIGNDIVTVIFQEPDCLPFSPKVIRSHFQHIFLVVRVENPGTDYTKYRVAVTRSQDIPYFGPPIPEGGLFDKNTQFRDFFLTKLINACNASLRSEKFSTMATRTRRQYLLDLCESSCSSVTIDQATGSGLVGLLSKNWGGKKRDKPRLQGSLVYTPGALVWNVNIIMKEGKPLPFSEEHDTGMDCILVLAADLMVFMYTNSRDNILHLPTKDISGWVQDGKRINLFYDGTSCLSLEMYEQEDAREITSRLLTLAPCLTASHEATLMEFQRTSGALLGFGINEACEVLRVSGQAKQIGLQVKSRILQVEDRLVCTHKHSQIIDILTDKRKTNVKAYVIPPVPTTQRPLLHYQAMNWQEVWSNRPAHMNGESEEPAPQNGTEPMETESSSVAGGSVALRGKRRAATVHGLKPHKPSYDPGKREPSPAEEQPQDDDEPIYDRLRSTEDRLSPTNIPRPQVQRARSPKPGRAGNTGFARVRSRAPGGGRDHVPAQKIAENIQQRVTERAASAGPSPEPLEHKLDVYTSHVPTHVSTSTFLPHSQQHTIVPLSSLRRKTDKVMIEILDPKSPTSSTSGCPPTPGSVQELAKKFSFSSPPPSNKSSPSRTSGGSVGVAKPQATPMKATVAASEMTRSGIPVPASTRKPPGNKFTPSPDADVQMRGKLRSPKMRPASWDASLIFDSEKEEKKLGKPQAGQRPFSREENGRLPVRKKAEPVEGRGESEEPLPTSDKTEELSQEEQISVRQRTRQWEARGSELPSFFSTLPKSFKSKGGGGAGGRPQSPNSPLSPSAGSRIPAPRPTSSSSHTLTQSLKARSVYSKQSTPPIQEEETDSQEAEEHIYNRLSQKPTEPERRERSLSPTTGSYPGGKVGGASQSRVVGRGIGTKSFSSSQVQSGQRPRPMSPVRATSPTMRTMVLSARSPSPNSGSRIPLPGSRRSPPPRGDQNISRPPRTATNPLDAVVLESALSSLQVSEGNRQPVSSSKVSSQRKVEEWLRHSTPATNAITTETPSLPGKQDSARVRMDGYRKGVHGRNSVKMAVI